MDNKLSVTNRLINLVNKFERVMLYSEVMCIPLTTLKSLQKNDLDIISMMDKKGLTSYCQIVENLRGEVYFDTLVLERNNVTTDDAKQFLSKLLSLGKDAKALEKSLSDKLGCEVASKITAVDVVVKLKDTSIRRYKVEDFIKML